MRTAWSKKIGQVPSTTVQVRLGMPPLPVVIPRVAVELVPRLAGIPLEADGAPRGAPVAYAAIVPSETRRVCDFEDAKHTASRSPHRCARTPDSSDTAAPASRLGCLGPLSF